jgi:Patatin-like phospholipase
MDMTPPAGAGVAKPEQKTALPGQVVLAFQGGGALTAYQGGVYEALHAAGIEPDWVIGTSSGAINAGIIAGNPPDKRLERLRRFWTACRLHPSGRVRSPNERPRSPCGAQHPSYSGLARPSLDHQHGRLHGAGAEQIQGLLDGLTRREARRVDLRAADSLHRLRDRRRRRPAELEGAAAAGEPDRGAMAELSDEKQVWPNAFSRAESRAPYLRSPVHRHKRLAAESND